MTRGVTARAVRRVALGCAALVALVAPPTGTTQAQGGAATRAYRPGFDAISYDFAVSFPARGAMDSVGVVASMLVRRSAPIDTLTLDLLAPMTVRRAMVNGKEAPFRRDAASVRLGLPRGTMDTLAIVLVYDGRPRDGLVIRSDSLGRWTAFGDNYPDRARHWLPTIDHPSDKATVSWTIRHPVGTRAIANGALVEETPDMQGGLVTTRWRSTRPLYTAVMVIGVAPFSVLELDDSACGMAELPGCVHQSLWVAPEVRASLPAAFAQAAGIVDFFSRLVAPFPYEKLAHVQSFTRWGGMENAAAIFYSDDSFRRPGGVNEGTIAHEIAHQWFGDAVTEREWPHVWLSEGFATYFAALWTERSRGDSAFRDAMRGLRTQVLEASVTMQEPIVRDSVPDLGKLLNSNVYQKAGFVLHMLRREVGDSAFFRGVRAYYAQFRHGNALSQDFFRAIETAAGGRKLDWFYEQWMRRPGVADVTISWRWDAARKVIQLTASQGGKAAPYRLNLALDVTDARGRTQRVRVSIPESRAGTIPVSAGLTAAPARVVVDPDVSILGRLTVRP